MPRAFITGITGQDGQHLAEFLHSKGYEVFGMVKGQNNPRMTMMRDEFPYVEPVPGDLADLPSLVKALESTQPDEVYNLGRDLVRRVELQPGRADGEHHRPRACCACSRRSAWSAAPRTTRSASTRRSSREMFGKVRETPQTETTPFHPRSPYGCAKVFGHDITVNYRESYGLFACSGILFNHEGPRRGLEFVTRKVTNAVARIKLGLQTRDRARQPRLQARLGLRRRLREGDVADAAAGPSPTTTSSPPARPTRSRISSAWRSARSASRTGATTSARTRSSSARPRSTC